MKTLAEHRARLELEHATPNQAGAIQREFERLGFHPRYDRTERLRLTAILADYPGDLATTGALSMGEAGRVVRHLAGCRTTRDLYALTAPALELGHLADQLAELAGFLTLFQPLKKGI